MEKPLRISSLRIVRVDPLESPQAVDPDFLLAGAK
jgi:hypothetical protein